MNKEKKTFRKKKKSCKQRAGETSRHYSRTIVRHPELRLTGTDRPCPWAGSIPAESGNCLL
jgi:hypothetical protein